jgi:hypothetical protein
MNNPILQTGYWFGYYECNRDPTSTEDPSLVYTDIPDFLEFWWNTISGDFFYCPNNTLDEMIWNKFVDNNNISEILTSLGIPPPVSRLPIQRSSPAFSTSYQPSLANDTEIYLTLNFTSLLSLSSTVDIEISENNSNWTTIFTISKSLGLSVNENDGYTFRVPIGCYYRIVQASGTEASIVSIYELSV